MQNNVSKSGCMNRLDYSGVDHLPLAMAYIPWQTFHITFDRAEGFCKGTIFPELYKPFCGKGGACR